MADVSDVPLLVGRAKTAARGGLAMELQQQYTPPLDGTPDELKEFDLWIARRVAETLVGAYHGYPWKVVADSRQGVVMFQIPELMGATLHYVIRLGQYADLTPKLIVTCAGELLERMALPRRGITDFMEVVSARARKHTFEFSDLKRSA